MIIWYECRLLWIKWTMIKIINEMDYTLKEMNEVDYDPKEMRWNRNSEVHSAARV